MRTMHRPGTIVQAGNKNLLHAQCLDAGAGANDVGDRVQAAHFVELYVIDGLAMNLGLGLGDPMEDGQRVLLHKMRELAVFD